VKVHVSAIENSLVIREVSHGDIVAASRQRDNWYFVGGGWVSGSFIRFGNTQATVEALVTAALSYTPPASPTAMRTPIPTRTPTFTPTHVNTPRVPPTLIPSLTLIPTLTPQPPPTAIPPTRVPPSASPTIVPTPAIIGGVDETYSTPKQGVIFTTSGRDAFVRYEPSPNSTVKHLLSPGDVVSVSARVGDWYFVGDGWVNGSLIRFGGNPVIIQTIVKEVASYTPPPITNTPLPTNTPTPLP
jgi:hypothetical protein